MSALLRSTFFLSAFGATLLACGPLDDEATLDLDIPEQDVTEELGTHTSDLINGTVTYKTPSVGLLRFGNSLCTATLVTPTVAITAAHCVGYGTALTPGNRGSFVVYHSSTKTFSYTVSAYRSFDSRVGANDIALLRLATAVPASVVNTPARLARGRPQSGESVTLYGFGCTARGTRNGVGTKRALTYTHPRTTANLCPGDSGGPTLRANGAIFRINSGYWISGSNAGADIYGDVPANFDRLMPQVNAWTSSGQAPTGAIVVDSNNSNNDTNRGYVAVSSNWKASNSTGGYYGTGYWYASTQPVADAATFYFYMPKAGTRVVEAWWTAGQNRSARAPFVITDANGNKLATRTVDQRTGGSRWNSLGSYAFPAGWNKVQLSRWTGEGAVVIADAVRIR